MQDEEAPQQTLLCLPGQEAASDSISSEDTFLKSWKLISMILHRQTLGTFAKHATTFLLSLTTRRYMTKNMASLYTLATG